MKRLSKARQVKYSSGLGGVKMVRQRTDGSLAMRDEVIGDDEILWPSGIVASDSPSSTMSTLTRSS